MGFFSNPNWLASTVTQTQSATPSPFTPLDLVMSSFNTPQSTNPWAPYSAFTSVADVVTPSFTWSVNAGGSMFNYLTGFTAFGGGGSPLRGRVTPATPIVILSGQPWTIGARHRIDTAVAGLETIIDSSTGSNFIGLTTNGFLAVTLGGTTVSNFFAYTNTLGNARDTHTPQDFFITYDGSTAIKIYTNGVLTTNYSSTPGTTFWDEIGSKASGSTYSGAIQYVGIATNHACTSTEILALHKAFCTNGIIRDFTNCVLAAALDESSGNYADSSVSALTGTPVGTFTRPAGILTNGFSVTTKDTATRVGWGAGSSNIAQLGTSLTITCWVQFTAQNSNQDPFWGQGLDVSAGPLYWIIQEGSNFSIEGQVFMNGTDGIETLAYQAGAAGVPDGVMHFCTYILDITGKKHQLYVDGYMVNGDHAPFGAGWTTSAGMRSASPFNMGNDTGSHSCPVIMDECRVYTEWLTPARIWNLYANPEAVKNGLPY